ncbi:alpha-L-rhamnosidase C-terminal domain-containing protein [Streptomyces sp. NPDC048281]|uniref:alpha-L-rhamnosidase C-terminal domain-containing protein n=1 Tax=Streptomyces sp. NPDC048281 TaxID=3154715 RepID=UPI0034315865
MAVFGPDSPGFRHFLLQPHIDPTGRITRVAGSYASPYGEIRSEWRVEDSGSTLAYEGEIPDVPAFAPQLLTRSAVEHVSGVEWRLRVRPGRW